MLLNMKIIEQGTVVNFYLIGKNMLIFADARFQFGLDQTN